MKPAREALNVNIRTDLRKMRHFGSEMRPKSVACDFFIALILFEASLTFYVDSYALSGSLDNGIDSSLWDKGSEQKEIEWNPRPLQTNGADPERPRRIPQQLLEGTDEYEKWPKLLTFDKSKNLSEIDTRPGNESKIIVISEKEHFEVYENNEDEDENGNQLRENIFQLLNSENLLSHLTTGQTRDLQRSKREADDEPKKRRCRCRRVWRRTGVRRRRRRRRRNGQQNRRRRRRQRRRRRRCVCRNRDGEEGKTDVEKPDGEGSEGSGGGGDEGGEEGGDEGADEGGDEGEDGGGNEGGDEGEDEGGESDGDGEDEEDEGSGEDTDEESSNENGEGEDPLKNEGGQLISPGSMIPIPPGSMVWVPGQGMPSYPIIRPPPNIMPNVGGIPVGSKP